MPCLIRSNTTKHKHNKSQTSICSFKDKSAFKHSTSSPLPRTRCARVKPLCCIFCVAFLCVRVCFCVCSSCCVGRLIQFLTFIRDRQHRGENWAKCVITTGTFRDAFLTSTCSMCYIWIRECPRESKTDVMFFAFAGFSAEK